MKPAVYFEHYEDYFWIYEAAERVLSIPNSYTTAYLDFVLKVLEKLAPQGLPRFGTILLALAATNQEGEKALSTIRYDYTAYNYSSTQGEYDDAFMFLRLLTQLPEKYRRGNNRILVLQAIFEESHNLLSPAKSEAILEAYRQGVFEPFSAPARRFKQSTLIAKSIEPFKKDHSYKDIKPFYLLSKK